jgi:hypothetical protein
MKGHSFLRDQTQDHKIARALAEVACRTCVDFAAHPQAGASAALSHWVHIENTLQTKEKVRILVITGPRRIYSALGSHFQCFPKFSPELFCRPSYSHRLKLSYI